MDVPSREEYNILLGKVDKQATLIQDLLLRLSIIEKEPCQWYMASVFRQKFYPETPASTFSGWVKKWIANGTLEQNKNCRYAGTTLLISSDFARSINPLLHNSQLRKTG